MVARIRDESGGPSKSCDCIWVQPVHPGTERPLVRYPRFDTPSGHMPRLDRSPGRGVQEAAGPEFSLSSKKPMTGKNSKSLLHGFPNIFNFSGNVDEHLQEKMAYTFHPSPSHLQRVLSTGRRCHLVEFETRVGISRVRTQASDTINTDRAWAMGRVQSGGRIWGFS